MPDISAQQRGGRDPTALLHAGIVLVPATGRGKANWGNWGNWSGADPSAASSPLQIHPSRTSALALMDLVRGSSGGGVLDKHQEIEQAGTSMEKHQVFLMVFHRIIQTYSNLPPGNHRFFAVTLVELFGSLLIAITVRHSRKVERFSG